ncbi:hypothetical protein L218DRAFT_964554 [Marasmius fiardii PR-910]|nr:hypothetical protein L218DRAFT_964554 [Marasmius fiardii PR-910]
MKQVWNNIEDVYSKALGAGPLAPAEWVDIENIRRNLEMEASRIRVEALEGYRWKTYCGFNPLLMPRIARWYKMSKELEYKMIIVSERDKQSRLEPDGQIATGSPLQAQVSPHLDIEKPVGSQYGFPPSPPSAA